LGCTSRKLELPQIKEEEKMRNEIKRGGVNIGVGAKNNVMHSPGFVSKGS
jgi:hypothetical protein